MEKFFRSQMIPMNPTTMCYWAESDDGTARDLLPESLPDGTIVTDVTYPKVPRQVVRRGDSFESHVAV